MLRKGKVDDMGMRRKTTTMMMMMRWFCGWHALFMMVGAGEENPACRDEVVQIAGYGEEKISTVLITGSVHCQPPHKPHACPLQGAWVGVKCERRGKGMVAEGVTDEFGDFIIDLPSHLHAIPNLEKVCSAEVHRIPKASSLRIGPFDFNKHKALILSSFGNGIRTYNAGNITIQHIYNF